MVALNEPGSVKVYTVNGAASGSSSSLPDWLTRKRAAKGKGKRAIREHIEGSIELIQHFEFPEASNRIKTTRDGHHAIATGVYKPQMRVYDLDQLTLKFERHSDVENVDFIILSDDWTKTLHLQSDRSIELHTQGGFHYRTRIPRFGRALAYHFPSCDALVSASGPEIYRLNLAQGRFLNPLVLEGDGGENIAGVNAIDINPAHQLFAFGVEGNGTVEFWDPRARARVGILHLPRSQLMPPGSIASTLPGVDGAASSRSLSVTAIASRTDGLSYAVGTSTGHTLLYDIRSPKPLAMKDLGYGLPVKNVAWIEGGSRMAGDGMVLSADRKVIKIWDRDNATSNFASITPATDINHVHHIPSSGLVMVANEGIRMTTYYIPQLGPAPRWCSFLENITEEMEDQAVRNVYEDYKFVERSELSRLGLDHLVGTPALKPYMHGYFLSLRLYDTARVIANPFAYAEHREKLIKEKMEKLSEGRIRTRKEAGAVKVNKALAERVRKEEEKAKRKEERRKERKKALETDGAGDEDEEVEHVDDDSDAEKMDEDAVDKPNLLNDPRFQDLFKNPEFEVDEESREFNMLHPSAAAQKARTSASRGRTAVEEEEEDSEKMSSDGLGESESEEGDSDDSSDAGDLDQYDPRARPASSAAARPSLAPQRRATKPVRMVPMRPQTADAGGRTRGPAKDASFGQRRLASSSASAHARSRSHASAAATGAGEDGGMQISWVPGSSAAARDVDDMLVPGGRGKPQKSRKKSNVESFGAGMERGGDDAAETSERERKGRTQRRSGVRSGSRNVFRNM